MIVLLDSLKNRKQIVVGICLYQTEHVYTKFLTWWLKFCEVNPILINWEERMPPTGMSHAHFYFYLWLFYYSFLVFEIWNHSLKFVYLKKKKNSGLHVPISFSLRLYKILIENRVRSPMPCKDLKYKSEQKICFYESCTFQRLNIY